MNAPSSSRRRGRSPWQSRRWSSLCLGGLRISCSGSCSLSTKDLSLSTMSFWPITSCELLRPVFLGPGRSICIMNHNKCITDFVKAYLLTFPEYYIHVLQGSYANLADYQPWALAIGVQISGSPNFTWGLYIEASNVTLFLSSKPKSVVVKFDTFYSLNSNTILASPPPDRRYQK